MLISCVIIYALIQVPRELQSFAELEAEQKKHQQEETRRAQAQTTNTPHAANTTAAAQASHHEEEVELAHILASPSPLPPSPSGVASGFHPIGATSSSSPPPSSPSQAPASPSHQLSSATPVDAALPHFLVGDMQFLCRWAELQLTTGDPQRLHRVAAALGLSTSASSSDAIAAGVVAALFQPTAADQTAAAGAAIM